MKVQKRSRLIFLTGVVAMLMWAGTDAQAYLTGSAFDGQVTTSGGGHFDQCLNFLGNGQFEAFGGTYSGPYSELQIISAAVLQIPFVTFWQGMLNDPKATRFVGVIFFGFLYSRVAETQGSGHGHFIGVRTGGCGN